MQTKAFLAIFRVSVLSLLLAGVLHFAPSTHAASYSVTITATQFVPATLQTAVGDTVTFINSTTATQSARSSTASGFNTGDIGPSKSKSVTLTNPGTFTYTSQYDSALTGVLTVTTGTTSLSGESTATPTATTTTLNTTQPQPVSGTLETLVVLLAGGTGLLLTGAAARWKEGRAGVTLIDVPLVSSKHGTISSTESQQRE